MMLNPGVGDGPWKILFLIGAVGMLIGYAWLHRISTLDEDSDRSWFRMHGRAGGGSRFPDAPGIPSLNWLLTRGAILIGAGAVAFTLVAPLLMRRWIPLWDAGPIAIVAWLAAIAAATIGTAWMIRIAVRGPEHGAPRWRSRR
jgi:hypothetical protein